MIAVEHIHFRIAGDAQEIFVAVAVEQERRAAGRVGSRLDVAHAFLAETRVHLVLRMSGAGETRAEKKCDPGSGHHVVNL